MHIRFARRLLATAAAVGVGAIAATTLALAAPADAAPAHTLFSNSTPTSTTNFTIKPGWTITKTVARGQCTGSEVIPGAARCFSGILVLDPCWTFNFPNGHPGGVVCPTHAWTKTLTRVKLPRNEQGVVRGQGVYAVTLANGTHCTKSWGAVGEFHGYPIRYDCADGRGLIRSFDRSHALWHVTFVATFGYDRRMHAGTATVTRVWFGYGHRGAWRCC